MKRLPVHTIIFLLLPILLIHFLSPKEEQNRLAELMAKQPVFVYSFVWVPLMEISMLVMQQVIPPSDIKVPGTNSQQKPSSPANNEIDYLISLPLNIFFVALRIVTWALMKLWELCFDLNPITLGIFPLITIFYFQKQHLFHSNPRLPRGEPPALPCCPA